jgi:hypothetical protein
MNKEKLEAWIAKNVHEFPDYYVGYNIGAHSMIPLVLRLQKALDEVGSYHGKCMMGPTDEECEKIYERSDGFGCYREAFMLGSYQSYMECVAHVKDALADVDKMVGEE